MEMKITMVKLTMKMSVQKKCWNFLQVEEYSTSDGNAGKESRRRHRINVALECLRQIVPTLHDDSPENDVHLQTAKYVAFLRSKASKKDLEDFVRENFQWIRKRSCQKDRRLSCHNFDHVFLKLGIIFTAFLTNLNWGFLEISLWKIVFIMFIVFRKIDLRKWEICFNQRSLQILFYSVISDRIRMNMYLM